MKLIDYHEAIRLISTSPDRYACYFGAGVSSDAEVPLAANICKEIAKLRRPPKLSPAEFKSWRSKTLKWNDLSERYSTCVQALPDLIHRIQYFRTIVDGKTPTFAHHALALLMQDGVFKRTAITTNFDRLLEHAFVLQGKTLCQPIRNKEEAEYWQQEPERYYLLKIHGDCDTFNIANTLRETVRIGDELQQHTKTLASYGGLVVVGTAGNERSVQALFDDLEKLIDGPSHVLDYGLLWGVHIPGANPLHLSDDALRKKLRAAVESTVDKNIRHMMERAGQRRNAVAFFPIWGAARFFEDVIDDVAAVTSNHSLASTARRYLDHETRLRRIFLENGLSDSGITTHLDELRENRARVDKQQKSLPPEASLCITAKAPRTSKEVRIFQGDITDRRLLRRERQKMSRHALISPEDTCVSAGGGVAYKVARHAGLLTLLNDLDKIGSVSLGQVAVTSAGDLPVEYIFHAAAGKVEPNGTYYATKQTVADVVADALLKAKALGVSVIWCPLLAAGRGKLSRVQSLKAICEIAHQAKGHKSLQFNVVVWGPDLDRTQIRRAVRAVFSGWNID